MDVPKNEKKPGILLEELLDIMDRLRKPDGCPWDREQTYDSLKPYLVEEAYEVIEAIDREDYGGVAEECGDLLLQVVFIAQIAREEGRFDMSDVLDGVARKMVRRHPHVFGDLQVADSGEVSRNWEQIKKQEKARARKDVSLLSGVPRSLPGLLRAYQIQSRAAKVGFDWPRGDLTPVLAKIHEEVDEIAEAAVSAERHRVGEELGDLFFALVNLARHLDFNPEVLIQEANGKFADRFGHIEEKVNRSGRDWGSYSLEELDGFWEEAKKALLGTKPEPRS